MMPELIDFLTAYGPTILIPAAAGAITLVIGNALIRTKPKPRRSTLPYRANTADNWRKFAKPVRLR
jgi:hypothetical protein